MRHLNVFIEIKGSLEYVGDIEGTNELDAGFRYDGAYAKRADGRPISVSLPLTNERFSAAATRNFFEGMLPEGFTRKSVAKFLRAEETDYLSILAGLGKECLGAIKIAEDGAVDEPDYYDELTGDEVRALAAEGTTKSTELVVKSHLSLTGASGKVGLYLDKPSGKWYRPQGDAPSTHIVKQSHVRLDGIVVNEQLCLMAAGKLGIKTQPCHIINMGAADDGDVLLATERYDRKIPEDGERLSGLIRPLRLHQEDFAQALAIAARDKYEHEPNAYMQAIFKLITSYSANPIEDRMRLWSILCFDWLVGNTDNHIKNIGLLYSENLKSVRLAPAYDILSTAIYESSTRDMAISIGGKWDLSEIGRASFAESADLIGMGQKPALSILDKMTDNFENALNESARELKDMGFENALKIRDRILKAGGWAEL